MKRKVIQIADSTQLISLPREWAKKNNIMKGQELELEDDGDRIIIHTGNTPQKSRIEINLSGLTPRLADRFLARAYQLGYDELTIDYDSLDIALALQKKVPELMGFEIFDQSKSQITIKSLSSKIEIDFDSAFRKAFLIALGIANRCLEATASRDKKTLEHIPNIDMDLNKFCYFCLRAINKGQYRGYDNRILYYLIETLEDVGDAYKELALDVLKNPANEKIIRAIERINKIFKISYDFFYDPDKAKAVDAYGKLMETSSYLAQLTKNHGPSEGRQICILNYLLRLIYHYTTMRLDSLREFKTVE